MQSFKNGDVLEKKFENSAAPVLNQLSIDKNQFLAGCQECGPLGDMIFESKRAPLSNAIKQSIYRTSFKEIFDAFIGVGTAEAYLTVFRKIFGINVAVTFTVPAAGKLNIDIVAAGVEISTFVARYIEDNVYLFDDVIDTDLNNIVFQGIKGFQTQYELEKMLFEMVPGGIFTTITLTLG
mgnify:CR=1 FL=1